MKIYLYDNKDNLLREFRDVIEWGETYVVYKNSDNICKIYANDNEYFSSLERVLED